MPYFIERQGDKHCVMKGVRGEESETVKCHPDPASAQKHLAALMVNVEDAKAIDGARGGKKPIEELDQSAVTHDERSDLKTKFISYKSGDQWRWLSVSSTAVEDREYETVSEKAYDDAITHASLNGYGDLDLVHVDGTEVGTCDLMSRLGQSLLEGGIWHDTTLAQKVRSVIQTDPDKWGVSIKFQYDPEQFDGSVYHGGIRILKRSILPRQMAASLGTAIVVQGGKTMKVIDEATKGVLMEFGLTAEEVTELSEKQKSLPDVANVKEKQTIWSILKGLLIETPETTTTPDVVEQPAAEAEVNQEKSQDTKAVDEKIEETVEVPVTKASPLSELVLTEEAVKTISMQTAQIVAPAIQKALDPILQQLSSLTDWSEAVTKRLAEVEKDIETKVAEKIDSLPPIVKIRTTELKQAETQEQPDIQSTPTTRNAEFVKSVSEIVTQALGSALGTGEFKL